jgi:CheY-like chemotaxis protein
MSDGRTPLGRIQLRQIAIPAEPESSRSPAEDLRALSERHGVPALDLLQVCIRTEHLILPREVAERRGVLPVLVNDERLVVATHDPSDSQILEDIASRVGMHLAVYVAPRTLVIHTIGLAYDALEAGQPFFVGPTCPEDLRRRLGILDPSFDDRPTEVVPPPPDSDEDIVAAGFGDVDPENSVVTDMLPFAAKSGRATIVLAVEDREVARAIMRTLISEDFRVLDAGNAPEALRIVKAHVPDVLIVSTQLPGGSGPDIARLIRASARYGHIPLVLIDDGECVDLDDVNFVVSPRDLPHLQEILPHAVTRSRELLRSREAQATTPVALMPTTQVEQLLGDAVAAYERGEVNAAVTLLQAAVGIDPLAFRVRLHLGLLLGRSGRVEEAIEHLERAVDQNDRHFGALKNLAVLYQRTNWTVKAVRAWQRAHAVAPDDPTRAKIAAVLAGMGVGT